VPTITEDHRHDRTVPLPESSGTRKNCKKEAIEMEDELGEGSEQHTRRALSDIFNISLMVGVSNYG